MRRSTLLTACGVLALTGILPTAGTASAGAAGDRPVDAEVLRLDCAARSTDAGPAVHCEWSQPQSASAAGVKLFRLDPAVDDHRRVVYRSGNLAKAEFTDTKVRTGHRYAYAVVALNADGRLVARSRPEWVRVPATTTTMTTTTTVERSTTTTTVAGTSTTSTSPDRRDGDRS